MIDSVVCGTVVTLCTSQAAAGLSDNYFKKWWPCFKFGVQAWVIAIFSATQARDFRVKLPGSGPGHPESERHGTRAVTVTILLGTASRSSPSHIGYQLGDGVTGDGFRLELPVRELEGRLAH